MSTAPLPTVPPTVGGLRDLTVHVREPDTAATVAFRTVADGTGELFVLGPRTRASYLTPKNVPHCVTLRLSPGRARPLLGLPMSELVDRIVPLRELWGAQADLLAGELTELVASSGPGVWRERVAGRMQAALSRRLAERRPAELARGQLLDTAAALLSRESERVTDVARELGVSERHLRNLFSAGVGVSPKRFARIHRVRGVLARVCREGSASLAADTGYYDQSHMTAEFHEVMGVPPNAFRSGRLPAPGSCSAA
ncbi:helix-turn-helix domain-containing protein [Nonomuraea sp. NPDC005983]|uniref:helix-turn-helix domain-containing protein n=1 Tax=Nonomuraea sp. NPDC005983 TaxID=3155595 RepID=UPI0033AF37A2